MIESYINFRHTTYVIRHAHNRSFIASIIKALRRYPFSRTSNSLSIFRRALLLMGDASRLCARRAKVCSRTSIGQLERDNPRGTNGRTNALRRSQRASGSACDAGRITAVMRWEENETDCDARPTMMIAPTLITENWTKMTGNSFQLINFSEKF